jgi:hypothetical protein
VPEVITWIESHPVTVGIIQWIIVGLIAWVLGFFNYIRTILKRPKVEVEKFTSRCFWEEMGVIDGNDHNARVTFLIEAGVNNPTKDPIYVRDFTVQIKRLKKWPLWHDALNAVTLPSRVRHLLPNITRYLKNWFSNFEEGGDYLTLDAKIEPREFQSGFLLFVSFSWGYMRPLVKDGAVPIKLKARLTTGEILEVKSSIHIVKDRETFESMVPGIFTHVCNSETWNIIRQ